MWIPHLDGIPFRKLGNEYGLSPAQVYKRVKKEMDNLPNNTWLTAKYCNRFCGILVIDGKYVKVKGHKEKIPFIYAIDYLTHDPLVGLLAPSENEEAFLKLFRLLKTCNYPLQIAIADDRSSLIPALKYHYPKALFQLCQVHYLENIREQLHIRTISYHHHFFHSLVKHVFEEHTDEEQLNSALHHVLTKRAGNNPTRQAIVMDIHRRRKELFAYAKIPRCPRDTNLIELFNSHANGRLPSLKGFKSFTAAERWLNAHLIRRRTSPFTDCEKPFTHLNGKCPMEMTLKKQAEWSEILKKYQLEMKR